MRLYFCVILWVLCVVDSKRVDKKVKEFSSEDSAELTVQGVIKNISNVNHILKDLLKNYKHLKNICNSVETEESKQVTRETEDFFNDSNVKRKIYHNDGHNNNRVRQKKKTEKLNGRYVTRMFISNESGEKSSKQSYENDKNKEIGTDAKTSIEQVTDKSIEKITDKSIEKITDKSSEKSTDKSIEKSKENSKPQLRKHKKKPHKNEVTLFDELNEEEEEHIHSKIAKALKHKIVKLVGRNTIQRTAAPDLDDGNDTQVLRSSLFREVPRRYHNRRIPDQVPLLIIANSSIFDEQHDLIDKKEDDNAFINDEQFKTDILRSTYSDACLKLVIRKCYQAGKHVLKRGCRSGYKCKKHFKAAYETNQKRGCIKYFNAGEKESYTAFRGGKGAANEDFAKGGYLAAACFPYKEAKTKTNHKSNKGNTKKTRAAKAKLKKHKDIDTDSNSGEQTEFRAVDQEKLTSLRNATITTFGLKIQDPSSNILRDRLEKQCQIISASKCKKACRFAFTEACKVHPKCNKDKKKEFNKECKLQCNKSYGVNNKEEDTETASSPSSESSSTSSKSDDAWGL